MRPKLRPPYLALIIITVIIDQLSKYLINITLLPGDSIPVLGDFIRFTFIYNAGGAFGITFSNYWIYVILSSIAVIIVVIYFLKSSRQPKLVQICLALVVSGAFGNMIDRLFYSKVTDFIDIDIIDIAIPPFSFLSYDFGGFYLYRWYTFNIADAAITLGMIGLIIYLTFIDKPGKSFQADRDPKTL